MLQQCAVVMRGLIGAALKVVMFPLDHRIELPLKCSVLLLSPSL